MTINYLSVCSGIDSVSVAWHPLGWNCVGLSEIHPFRSAVLNYHYPEIKNFGDFTGIQKDDLKKETYPDILVGGTPCASFGISGLRKGFEDDRGNLALEFILLADRLKTSWILWENVPGLLSSDKGRDFGNFLGALAECGYGFAYRVLDAQYTRTQRFPRALPQRRRRVFVVGHLGDWRPPAEVLFDREALSWNHPPSRKQREASSRSTTHRITRSDKYVQDEIASTIRARDWKEPTDLVVDSSFCFEPRSQDGVPRIQKEPISPTLNAMRGGQRQPCVFIDGVVPRNNIIRRLTVKECERLQGFADDWTKGISDTQRYKCLGNAVTTKVVEYIVGHWNESEEK